MKINKNDTINKRTKIKKMNIINASRWEHLVEPAISLWQQGIERHELVSRDITIIELFQGDKIDVLDVEGQQIAHLFFIDKNSENIIDALKEENNKDTKKNVDWNQYQDKIEKIKLQKIKKLNEKIVNQKAIEIFQDTQIIKQHYTFNVDADGICIAVAPADEMTIEGYNAPSTIEILVRRNNPTKNVWHKLPEPLADTLQDIHVPHSSAREFEIKKGEYIQIIDVSGRQCSDFQGMTLRGLDQGRELEIHSTTTRSMNSSAYPGPGLHSKFFNLEQEPMFEVIRDTVGRHDTFGLACYAKFYEELGYPGHTNCTDNINGAWQNYGIKPRAGWEAINFFFNTKAENDNSISSDEAWSRPGDYVLMRALTDCLCVATSCPNDLDAGNGWNPTDIHVRTYKPKELFSKSIAIRMTPDANPKLTRNSPFHEATKNTAKEFEDIAGVWLPKSFKNHGAIEEYHSCREKVMMIDMSSLRKFEIIGPDAEDLMNLTLTRNIKKLAVGQIVYSAMCYETGGMIDDGTLFRMGDELFRWVCAEDYCGIWLREIAEKNNMKVWIKPSTEQLANVAVQGPESRKTLEKIIWTRDDQTKIQELRPFRFSIARLKEFNGIPIVISRTGYTGELGYEIFCHPKNAIKIWEEIMNAGKEFGITPFGFDALEMVRIEAGLVMGHKEFNDTIDPFEAGIGFTVPLKSKNENFIGRDAIEKRKIENRHCLVGLELEGNELAMHEDVVFDGRASVGIITSATKSPLLNKNIALCRIEKSHSKKGTKIEIGKLDGHQKRIKATVVNIPFYDPERTRMRA